VAGAVHVRAESDTLGGDLPEGGQRKELIASGVGQDVALPAGKRVEPACGADDVDARSEVEVIGVAEYEVDAHLLQPLMRDGLDGSIGSDRHEERGFDRSVRQLDTRLPGLRAAVCCRDLEFQ
jgi:hypothetical protein